MRAFLAAIMASLILATPARAGFERLFVPKSELIDPAWLQRTAGSSTTIDHQVWGQFLGRYVTKDGVGINRISYARVSSADRAALEGYLSDLRSVDPSQLDRDEQLAFWINLYNAQTVALILANYPVGSIRDISTGLFGLGPWDNPAVSILGQPLSLNDIEHGVIRPVYQDARIHYALNCAAVSCPNLAAKAYQGATLEQDLARAEHDYINDPRGVRLRNGLLVISSIYVWFREDFADSEAGVLDYLRRHAEGRAAEALSGKRRPDDHAYDWALNDR
ncbi:MAG: DUF547 domain-containing protein [Pseudomonadota bacterium]